MIDYNISEVLSPVTLTVQDARALHRLLSGRATGRDTAALADALERSITKRIHREQARGRLLSLDS